MNRFKPSAKVAQLWNRAERFAPVAKDDVSELNIYGPIGADYYEGTSAKLVSAVLRNAEGRDVIVNINSPGGSVFEGLEIYHLLSEYKGSVTTRVGAIAASAASVIAAAAPVRQYRSTSRLMIHKAWTIAMGNSDEFEKMGTELRSIDSTLVDIYSRVMPGVSKDEIYQMMVDETYLTGADLDELTYGERTDAELDVDASAMINYAGDKALAAIEAALKNEGYSRRELRAILAGIKTSDTPSAVADTSKPGATQTPDLSKALAMLETISNVLKG